jgi:cell division protease FtsH
MKNLAFFLLILLILSSIFYLMKDDKKAKIQILPYSEFTTLVKNRQVKEAVIVEQNIQGVTKDNTAFHTFIPYSDPELLSSLTASGAKVTGMPKKEMNPFLQALLQIVPWILILGVFWFFMFRQIQGTGNKAMSFGKSRARMQKKGQNKITFADVAGEDEAKQELQEIIEFLKDPKKFARIGARIPKGVLLVGPPGTGKTLLAKAVAGEADVPFFTISGSDFVEMFVGVGASRVRDLFMQGKKSAPCIMFIDEIDAVGRHRGAGLGGGHDEREQTLNQLLVEMDGFETNEGVILVAATNRPDVLDPALLRPGRFDRQVVVAIPDVKGREGIFKVHTKKVPLEPDVDVSIIARGTPGFSGADIENLVNEAALLAARRNKDKVSMTEFEEAKDKVLMGPERRSMVFDKEEKEAVAWHEAGHALLGMLLPHSDPLHKVTIIPRGQALGLTQSLPEGDKHSRDRNYLLDTMVMFFGGRAAEEIKLSRVDTGAGNDIQRATELARRMICEWGMSTTLGPVYYGDKEQEIFLGREITQHKRFGEDTSRKIDSEVHNLVTAAYEKARKMLKDNFKALEAVALALIEKETLTRDEVETLIKTKKLRKEAPQIKI